MILEGFPQVLGIADQISGSAKRVEYSLRGRLIAAFHFGNSDSTTDGS
jgi:hypothetical protein